MALIMMFIVARCTARATAGRRVARRGRTTFNIFVNNIYIINIFIILFFMFIYFGGNTTTIGNIIVPRRSVAGV